MVITCNQLAFYFRQAEITTAFKSDAIRNRTYCEILKYFGDQAVPESFWIDYDREKVERFLSEAQD